MAKSRLSGLYDWKKGMLEDYLHVASSAVIIVENKGVIEDPWRVQPNESRQSVWHVTGQ
jgi:hypothetical protein